MTCSHIIPFGNEVKYCVELAPGKLLDNVLICIKLNTIKH